MTASRVGQGLKFIHRRSVSRDVEQFFAQAILNFGMLREGKERPSQLSATDNQ